MPKKSNRPKLKTKSRKTSSATKQEVTLLGQALRSLGAAGGGMLAGPTGSAVGSSLGAAISKWLGSGDYTVESNSIVRSAKASSSIPMMHTNNQTVTVRHKEYLGVVRSSIDYTIQHTYQINPGLRSSFPWLGNIAAGFSEYRIKGMVYHYVPTSGSAIASTNNALGSVMMTTNYRCTDSPPETKIELLNEYWSCESMPCETLAHPIECDPKENPFNVQYVRSASVPTGDSRLLYDLGNVYVATQGQQADGVTLGDLWVTYEVELKKPVLISNTTEDLVTTLYYNGSPTVTSGIWFNTSVTPQKTGNLDIDIINGRTIQLPKGSQGNFYFWIYLRSNGTVTPAMDYYQLSTLVNCNPVFFRVGTTDPVATTLLAGGGTSQAFYCIAVRKVDPQTVATITLPVISLAGTGTWNSSQLNAWAVPL
jgi:hypothetical protein